MTSNVVTEQPFASNPNSPQIQAGGLLVASVQGHRNWSTGLFDCFTDIGSCIKGYFCFPCVMCSLSARLGDNMCMPCCVQGALLAMRTRTRTLGGIQGTICSDCLVTAFCTNCAVCQLERELDNMNIH